MSRRLKSRPRSTAASSTPALNNSRSDNGMPEYEPQACPLDETARRALGDLSNNRHAGTYGGYLKDGISFLGSSISDLHERFQAQRERLDRLRRRREEKNSTEKSEEEERLEEHLADFGAQIDDITRQSELAVRHFVDCRAELEDETITLADAYTTATTQHQETVANATRARVRAGRLDPDDEDEPQDMQDVAMAPPVSSTRDSLRQMRDTKRNEFEAMSMYQRYGLNNDYAGFKKMWHDATQGEDGPPLADPSKWFNQNDQPVIYSVNALGDGTYDGGSDDDIAVAREVVSLRCPLTLRPLELPYSNRKCKHTFEKSALLDYLPLRGTRQCPQTGCSQTFTRAKFDEDFYLDQAILRRIERANQAQNTMEDMDEDEDGDEGQGLEGNSELMVSSQRTLRRDPKQEDSTSTDT